MDILSYLKQPIKNVLLEANLFYKLKDRSFYQNSDNKTQFTFYDNIIEGKNLVFDIGANIGQRAKIFSELPVHSVVAFEPQPFCIKHLKSRFSVKKNITIEEIALSNEKGERNMYVSSSHVLSTLSKSFIATAGKTVFKKENWDNEILVRTDTIDNMIKKYGHPDFIKIDVEGYEITVLKGLTNPVKHISFEFMPYLFDSALECINYLASLSKHYQFNYTLGESLSYRLDRYLPYDRFIELEEIKTANSFGDIYAKIIE